MSFESLRFLVPSLWPDTVEILLVAAVLYRFLLYLVGTRAIQIMLGLVILVVAYFAAVGAQFRMIEYILNAVFTYGAVVAVVVFQPELRTALARLGESRWMQAFTRGDRRSVAEEIGEALDRLARAGTGALVAIEGDIELDEFIASGAPLDAAVSADLLTTIFTPYAPLHDGAVLIRADRIIAAGCVLPLTQHKVVDKSLGTRHRAAIGLSEETDALVLVVSEETSAISVASRGRLMRNLTPDQVRGLLSGGPLPLGNAEPVPAAGA
ncbi:MAG TPA: diadenylate cyclase CdaA [Gemmatimonadales bacterium]|nr:diadenylate cyclase CdaA [Gemmatimonadales bacterium]